MSLLWEGPSLRDTYRSASEKLLQAFNLVLNKAFRHGVITITQTHSLMHKRTRKAYRGLTATDK